MVLRHVAAAYAVAGRGKAAGESTSSVSCAAEDFGVRCGVAAPRLAFWEPGNLGREALASR
jgi:hypothetical protein